MDRMKAKKFGNSATVTSQSEAPLGLEPWFPRPIQVPLALKPASALALKLANPLDTFLIHQ